MGDKIIPILPMPSKKAKATNANANANANNNVAYAEEGRRRGGGNRNSKVDDTSSSSCYYEEELHECLLIGLMKGKLDDVKLYLNEIGRQRNNEDNNKSNTSNNHNNYAINVNVKLKCNKDSIKNKSNKKYHTPLHIACQFGHLNIVSYLLQEPNIQVNIRNSLGETPFVACIKAYPTHHLCSISSMIKIISLLLFGDMIDKDNVNVINTQIIRDNTGMTGLHYSCRLASPDFVKFLLDNNNNNRGGYNVHIVDLINIRSDDDDNTPLYYAIVRYCDACCHHRRIIEGQGGVIRRCTLDIQSSFETVKLLLDYGAQIEVQNRWGETPIKYATLNNLQPILTLFRKYPKKQLLSSNKNHHIGCNNNNNKAKFYQTTNSDIVSAITNGNVDETRKLLQERYNSNAIAGNSRHGYPLLQLATNHNKPKIIELLLSDEFSDTNINAINYQNETAVSRAVKHSKKQALQALLDYQDNGSSGGHDDTSIQHIINPIMKDLPLHHLGTKYHLTRCQENTIRLLLERHSQVDIIVTDTDENNRTALDVACINGNLTMVKLLWSTGGARIVNQQTNKHTLGYVCKSHHSYILQFLLKHQPDLALNEIVPFCDDDGISIIDDEMPMLNYAAKLGFDSIVNIILKYHYNGDTSIVPSLDKNGNTPLHMAWSKKVAKQLLRRSGIGILTNTNNKGQTPIECVKDRLKNIKRICNYNLERIERQTDEMKKTITFYEKYMPKQNQQQSQHQSQKEGKEGKEEEDHQEINNVTVLSATTRIEENNNNNIDNDDPYPSSFSFDDISDNTGSGTARLRAEVEQTEEEKSIRSSSRTVVAAVLSQKSYRRHSHKQPLLTVSNNSSPPPTTASPSSTTETNNCIHSSFITNVDLQQKEQEDTESSSSSSMEQQRRREEETQLQQDSRKRPRLLNSTSTTTILMNEVVSTIAATPQLPLQSQRRDPSTSSPSQSTTLSTIFTNDDDPLSAASIAAASVNKQSQQEGTESMTQISSALTNTSSTLRVEETDEESGGKPNDIDINTVVVENQDNNNDNLAIPPSILPISPTNNEFQIYDDALLSETEEEEYPLHTSVKFGYINLVEEELQKIISNTNTVDGGGGSRNKETTTTTTENTSPTSSLLNTIDSKGRTALDLAALTGQLTIVDRLREAGCIYKYKNNSRMTAIANLRSKDVTMYLDKVRLSV